MVSFRRQDHTYYSPKSFVWCLATLITVLGLYSCSSQSGPTTSKAGSSSGSGVASPKKSTAPLLPALPKSQPSPELLPPTLGTEAQSPGLPQPTSGTAPKTTLTPKATTANPNKSDSLLSVEGTPPTGAANPVTVPPDLTQPASPIPDSSGELAKTTDPNGAVESQPSAPQAPLEVPSPSVPSAPSPNTQPDPSANLTEEAKSLNQPIDPNLQVAPSSSSASAPSSTTPNSSGTAANSRSDPRSRSSRNESASSSKPSGLRQPKLVYDPSRGVYTTESNSE